MNNSSPPPETAGKAHFVRDMFDTIADRYDILNCLLSLGRDRTWRRYAALQAAVRGGLVLDVGCGTGEQVAHLTRANADTTIIGLDSSLNMLTVARRKLAGAACSGRVHLVAADALHLPFEDNTFDSVTSAFVLRNLSDLQAAFREMARVVRPDGKVVSLELTRPSRRPLGPPYYWYLRRVSPFIGGLVSGQKRAYTYLYESIRDFPHPREVAAIIESAGLATVGTHQLTLGIATVLVAVKMKR